MEFKINFGDPKTGKTVKKVISDKEAEFFIKKKIGDKIKGDDIGFAGYEFEITGGSDYCGFPMRKDVRGAARKRILLVSGVGIRKGEKSRKGKKVSRKGKKIRKTVAGNLIYSKTAQINLKILKHGSKPLVEEKKEAPKEGEAPQTAEKPKAPEKKVEAPKKEDKKEDKPKPEEKKTEAPKVEKKEEKPEPKKEENPVDKKEAKPEENK